MKQFLKYSAFLILLIVGLLFIADNLYTFVYRKSLPRNKISLAYNGKPQEYDVIFLGSSRANNHFVPQIFIDQGFKSFNYGMSGSRLEESALLLQLLLEKGNEIKNIVLEVDLNINSNGFSEGTRVAFYPYLKDSETISNYYQSIPDYRQLYYVPYYRYLKYESRIGFRETFFTAIQQPTKYMQFHGFNGLTTTGKNMSYDLSDYSPKRNEGYELIKHICEKHKINLISVTTPMCENIKNKAYFDAVVKLYPEIHNLENAVANEDCFSTCGHMNEKGARQFTQIIFDKFFQ